MNDFSEFPAYWAKQKRSKSRFDWLPTWLIGVILSGIFVAALFGCQTNHYEAGENVFVFDSPVGMERGGQTTEAVNPDVDATVDNSDGGNIGIPPVQ